MLPMIRPGGGNPKVVQRCTTLDMAMEGRDFLSTLKESSGGRRAKIYQITIDMAKKLAMVESNEKGKEARRVWGGGRFFQAKALDTGGSALVVRENFGFENAFPLPLFTAYE